ncbi:MAG: hypothetical protein C5B50_13675 [Verrucomicrobia bacterium]|nr:MAG: hypothetical protein C5B50_13675 [Verrucomicrobiota bacterium]
MNVPQKELCGYPRLRADLIVSRQESASGVVWVVKDPVVGRFVRFKEPEYFVAQQLDGATGEEEIRKRAEEHFGSRLSADGLRQFLRKLETLGLIERRGMEQPARDARSAARLRGDIFSLRLKAFDPDRFLAAVAPRLGFVFTPMFAGFSLGLIALGAGVLIGNWQELHRSFSALYRVETIPLAWLTLLCIVVGHELSHGLACKRFGGKVHEIGLLLIYLQPAMYCNVSDAWMFPEKSRRLLVTLAGAWFELCAWAVAMLCWRVTEPGTSPNYVALLVATTLGIKTLFNLNPLIKLDGYYLLSDWVEIPNLRRRAFSYMRERVFRRTAPETRRQDACAPRVRRIYWCYGLLALTYSVWLIGFLLLGLGTFLTRKYQAWGLIGFIALVTTIFRRPLKRGAKAFGSQFVPGQGMLRRMKRLAKIALVAVALGAAMYFIRAGLHVSGEFRILPLHNAEVRAEIEGVIESVVHDENDNVNAGDLIAQLSDRDYRSELAKVKAEIAEKDAKLKMLKAGSRPEEIELVRTGVTKGEERVKYAIDYLDIEKKLFDQALSSRKDLELAEETAALRQKELEESKGTLKVLLAGSRPEEIEATEAEITRLVSQRTYLEEELKRLRIVSPIAGIVTAHRLKEKVGATVKKGDLITEVQELKSVTAEIAVPEQDISEVKIGQAVVLKARAHVDARFTGKVVAISPVASKPAEGVAQRTFIVTTEIDNTDARLKTEMSGNAKIYCGERRLYEVMFRRVVRFVRVEFWSWW